MISGNKITNTENNGIDTDDSGGHTIEKNKVTNAGEDGIEINDGSCTLTKNKVKNSGRHGIRLNSDDNTLEKNKASGSGKAEDGVDFWTDDDNLTDIKNKFKTIFDNQVV
jgi:parallel beta-helix repeat protein